MSKILSVCIPSYNMEAYLGRCLDSLLVQDVLDQIEVIVVNDGSKDATLAIANSYKERFPQSVVVIDKPNGHYGSCVNASLKVATGKYFRIVDADDWVDSQSLVTLVRKLEILDVDSVVTRFTFVYPDNGTRIWSIDAPFDKVLDLNQFMVPDSAAHMHCLTFSLDLIKRIGYTQTEGICYTDSQYVYFLLSCARSIYFMDMSLYQYFSGREGQSMDTSVLIKNNGHYLILIKSLENWHKKDLPFNNNEPNLYAFVIKFTLTSYALPHYLFYHKYNHEKEVLFRRVYKDLKKSGMLQFPEMHSHRLVKMMELWGQSGVFSPVLKSLYKSMSGLRKNKG